MLLQNGSGLDFIVKFMITWLQSRSYFTKAPYSDDICPFIGQCTLYTGEKIPIVNDLFIKYLAFIFIILTVID
jgi:hypothetical protein